MKEKKYKTPVIKMVVEELKKESNYKIQTKLICFNILIDKLQNGYSSSSQKLSWGKVDQAINFIKTVLMDDHEDDNYGEIDNRYISEHYFVSFIEFIYDEKSWEAEYFFELTSQMTKLLLYFFPDQILDKLKIPIKLLHKVNLRIIEKWSYQEALRVFEVMNSEFNNKKFINEFTTHYVDINSLNNKRWSIYFTLNTKRVVTYTEINEMMNDRIEFWEKLLNRGNYQIDPNRKYTPEMFEYTSERIFEGIKMYVACEMTLKKFRPNSLKIESYMKRYNAFLKSRNKLPQKRKQSSI